ncbi:hypothetical protein DFH27DRAFT_581886 [Peziza echinospora]|nr:hypothetical protein DFH27DRAFT_581886 [Peziza echinospora]
MPVKRDTNTPPDDEDPGTPWPFSWKRPRSAASERAGDDRQEGLEEEEEEEQGAATAEEEDEKEEEWSPRYSDLDDESKSSEDDGYISRRVAGRFRLRGSVIVTFLFFIFIFGPAPAPMQPPPNPAFAMSSSSSIAITTRSSPSKRPIAHDDNTVDGRQHKRRSPPAPSAMPMTTTAAAQPGPSRPAPSSSSSAFTFDFAYEADHECEMPYRAARSHQFDVRYLPPPRPAPGSVFDDQDGIFGSGDDVVVRPEFPFV